MATTGLQRVLLSMRGIGNWFTFVKPISEVDILRKLCGIAYITQGKINERSMSRKEYVTKGAHTRESNIFLRRGNYFVSSFSVSSRYIMITMMIFYNYYYYFYYHIKYYYHYYH